MKNFIQRGDTVDFTPTIAVASGVGYLVGTALFGVAKPVVRSKPLQRLSLILKPSMYAAMKALWD